MELEQKRPPRRLRRVQETRPLRRVESSRPLRVEGLLEVL